VAGKSEQLASLLDHALRFHEAHGDGDCPVCGRPNASLFLADETRRIWDQLRLQSNVSLEDVHLGGSPLSLSMDTARVDGLARVLQAASKDRQVIVFTHEGRLPEAVRRLDIDATIIEVTRREGSLVDTRRSKDPVSRYLDDAFALAKTDDLPPDIARRVIPGLCREALEAACMETVRRRPLTLPPSPSSTTWTAPPTS
jgi:hypothetical protein